MTNEQATDEAVKMAVRTYRVALTEGVDELFALQLAQNAHQHWLFALRQESSMDVALKSMTLPGD